MARSETPSDKRAKVKTSGLAKASGSAHADPRHGSGVRQGGRGTGKPPSSRELRASARRAAIVAAGLDEFTARGFAATRLDDVARRAGVAKGTIYLHFKDKEALFQELVRTALVPLIARMADPPLVEGISARALMEMFAETFTREVIGTRRGDILRMIISEGARFPSLAEFYHREVVSVGIAGMRRMLATTSSAVNGEPSLNRTPCRSENSQVSGSTWRHDVASVGVQWASASRPTRLS